MMILRYSLVGGTAAVVDITLFFLFAKLGGFNYLWVGAVGFIIATFVNYRLSIRFVFETGVQYTKRQEVILVYFVSAIGLSINQIILYTCVDVLHMEVMLSKITATGTVFFWNYYSRKHLIFKKTARLSIEEE